MGMDEYGELKDYLKLQDFREIITNEIESAISEIKFEENYDPICEITIKIGERWKLPFTPKIIKYDEQGVREYYDLLKKLEALKGKKA